MRLLAADLSEREAGVTLGLTFEIESAESKHPHGFPGGMRACPCHQKFRREQFMAVRSVFMKYPRRAPWIPGVSAQLYRTVRRAMYSAKSSVFRLRMRARDTGSARLFPSFSKSSNHASRRVASAAGASGERIKSTAPATAGCSIAYHAENRNFKHPY
jgi:hypothetical protein